MIMLFLALAAAGQGQPAATGAPPPKADPVICHQEEPDIGTRVRPKPVCMKKSDWDTVEKNAQEQERRPGDRSSR